MKIKVSAKNISLTTETPIKAITLYQPWATLIAYGYKRIETRSWQTGYRGPLGVHAGKKWNRQLYALCLTEPFRSCLAEIGIHNPDRLPRGCMIAKVNLWKMSHTEDIVDYDLFEELGSKFDEDFGDYTDGRFGWILNQVKRYTEPIPASGAMGLWDWYEPEGVSLIDVPVII